MAKQDTHWANRCAAFLASLKTIIEVDQQL